MTIYCSNCGTPNRDEAEVCSECGSIIPKLGDDNQIQTNSQSTGFDIVQEPQQDNFNIELTYPPPSPEQATSYSPSAPVNQSSEPYAFHQTGNRIVCERCGTVLHVDDRQCSGCGMPNTLADTSKPESFPPPPPPQERPKQATPPYPPPSPYAPPPTDPRTSSIPRPDPSKGRPKPQASIAKCAKCGAIVYEHESRCGNCGRILAPPKPSQGKAHQKTAAPVGKAPPGTARCSQCNAIVYPHQTNCTNCNRRLEPVSAPRGTGQRISRCKRCGHTVYPTDQVCPNCNRKLNPL